MKQGNFIHLKILNEKEKKEIELKLKEQFGISEIPGILASRGKERLYLFSGDFTEKEIKKIEEISVVERIGVYFAKAEEKMDEIRLSIEGTQILGNQITKNIFEIPEELVEKWMSGSEILFEDIKGIKEKPKGFIIIKHKNDFLGTGKASENKIGNFIPKNRRLKYKEN